MSKSLEELRREAHEAPLNKVFQNHKGHRFLGSHSMAWAQTSRAYFEALEKTESAALSTMRAPR